MSKQTKVKRKLTEEFTKDLENNVKKSKIVVQKEQSQDR